MNIHIHADEVRVETTPDTDWLEAKAIEIKRTGDVLEVRIALADGRHMHLTKHALADGAAIGLQCQGLVRVRADALEEPKK